MTHQTRFRDCITHLLTSACRPGRGVELHVAESLSRFFMSCPLVVAWGSTSGRSWVGARCDALGSPARSLSREEIAFAVGRLPPPSTKRHYDQQLVVYVHEAEGAPWGIELASADPRGSERFWLILEGDRAGPSDPAAFFRSYLQGQRELCAVVRALHSSGRLAEWNGEVDRLTSDGQTSLVARLERASGMVEEMSRDPTREMMTLIERLAIWAVQQLLGSGWSAHRMQGQRGAAQIQALCGHIRAAAEHWRARSGGQDCSFVGPLHCVADILDPGAHMDPRPRDAACEVRPGVGDALELLRTWTLMHEMARALSRGPRTDDEPAERTWNDVVTRARPLLAGLLEQAFTRANEDAARLRNWLRLWFCHDLPWELRCADLSDLALPSEIWSWRADLSYVLRESLRFECFGDRPDYRAQPAAFSAALRTLVEYHGRCIAEVPLEYDFGWILQEIAEVSHADEYHFAAGHLQHVLETYIAGHFLCSMEVRDGADRGGGGEVWTVAHLLVSQGSHLPGPEDVKQLRQVFSVAVLYHDVGMILFPRHAALRESLYRRGDPKLESHLEKLETLFGEASADMAKVCADDLEAARCVDLASETTLGAWLAAQQAHGRSRPDHALLGAWYLHRLSKTMRAPSSEVAPGALRAILLHQAVGHSIDVKRDPAAALLVLCDELFEWDPYMRALPMPNAVGRTLHTMAADMEPYPSRAKRIRICDLGVEVSAAGKVVPVLPRRASAPDDGWPRIEIELKHPEFLGGRVHQYWLTMAQNLGRLERSHAAWRPTVELISDVPPWLEEVGGSRLLLERAIRKSKLYIAPHLIRWLANNRHFRREHGRESVRLGTSKLSVNGEDIREHLQEIEKNVERVLEHHRWARRPGDPEDEDAGGTIPPEPLDFVDG